MKLTFYNNKDTTNTINKDLTELSTIDINFKQGQNMFNPSLILTKTNVPELANYCKLADKFYFINSTNEYHTMFLIINLWEDVLQTYKDDILKSSQDIIRKSEAGNVKQTNVSSETISKIYQSNKTLTKGKSIFVVTSGENFYNKGAIQ